MDTKELQKTNRIEMGSLVSWAVFFILVLVSHRLPLYINPRFALLPVIGAVITCGMVLAIKFGKKRTHCSVDSDWSLLTWFIMPIALGLMVAPAGLGTFVAGNHQSSLMGGSGDSSITLDLGASSAYKNVTIPELMQAGHIKSGKVTVVGQLVGPAPGNAPDEYLIANFTMVCCVADLRPVAILMKITGGFPPEQGQWVRVKGIVSRDKRGVVLTTQEIERIAEPNPPYLY